MITLSLVGFKKILAQQNYSVHVDNLAGLFHWIILNFPVIKPILFDSNSEKIKSFVCVLRNEEQIDCNDLGLPLRSGDKIEILLPMSGG